MMGEYEDRVSSPDDRNDETWDFAVKSKSSTSPDNMPSRKGMLNPDREKGAKLVSLRHWEHR